VPPRNATELTLQQTEWVRRRYEADVALYNAKCGAKNIGEGPTAFRLPLIGPSRSSDAMRFSLTRRNCSSCGGGEAAYVFAALGFPFQQSLAVQHLTAITLLLKTNPVWDTVSLQSGAYAENSRFTAPFHTKLSELGVVQSRVEPIRANCIGGNPDFEQRFKETFAIFQIYSLVSYQRILYLDSDLIVWRNVDHLLTKFLQSDVEELRTPTACNEVENGIHFNSGVWGIRPNTVQLHYIITALRKGQVTWGRKTQKIHCGIGFQTFLNQMNAVRNFTYEPLSIAYNLKPCADPYWKQHAKSEYPKLKTFIGCTSQFGHPDCNGTSQCLRWHGLPFFYILHWSGKYKPGLVHATTNESARQYRITWDPEEQPALLAYQDAYKEADSYLVAPRR